MARVFVARDQTLGRDIVAKVIAPELAEGLSIERFRREVRIAATLQHPHILPVLTSGEVDGLPFYTMPFVAEESLERRLRSSGALKPAVALRVLRDIADGLAYAHRHGIVHRDIKPANVLIGEGAAFVTDFGIAKAMSDASVTLDRQRLSATGAGIGTPAYMAPEQVVGDATTDHRADLYAFGMLAYETLTGKLPFEATTPQEFAVAHLTETPPHLSTLGTGIPPSTADTLSRCLLKDPTQRPQTAEAIVESLDEAIAMLYGARGAWTAATLLRVLALYAVATVAVVGAATVALANLDVPDWLRPAAIAVMAAGLPIIGLAFVASRIGRAGSGAPSHSILRGLQRLQPLLTRRRVMLGGLLATLGLVATVSGVMLARRAGYGIAEPFRRGGQAGARPVVLVADIGAEPADSTLAMALTEAARIGIGASGAVSVATPAAIREALVLMRRDSIVRLDRETSIEVARRGGFPVIVDGTLSRVRAGLLLTLRAVAADSANVVASASAVLANEASALQSMDGLLRRIRPVLGESYLSVRKSPPLPSVTTANLEALQLYAAAMNQLALHNDSRAAIPLLERATELDSTFASAWRLLASVYNNAGRGGGRTSIRAVHIAYRHRERTTPLERAKIEATYIRDAVADPALTLAAMQRVVMMTDTMEFVGNLSHHYMMLGRYSEAVTVARAGLRRTEADALTRGNLFQAALEGGQLALAESTFAEIRSRIRNRTAIARLEGILAFHRDPVQATRNIYADSILRLAAQREDPDAMQLLATVAMLRGRPTEASAHFRRLSRVRGGADQVLSAMQDSIVLSQMDLALRDDTTAALARWDATLRMYGPQLGPTRVFPYLVAIPLLVRAGRRTEAERLVAERERTITDTTARRRLTQSLRLMQYEVALAARRWDDASRLVNEIGHIQGCPTCFPLLKARAFDGAGESDSAITWYRRYLDVGSQARLIPARDGISYTPALERLSALYETRGNDSLAVHFSSMLLTLWEDAEPSMNGRIRLAQDRITRIRNRAPDRATRELRPIRP